MLRLVFNLTLALVACALLAQAVSRGAAPLPEDPDAGQSLIPEALFGDAAGGGPVRLASTEDDVLVYQIGSDCDDGTQYTTCGVEGAGCSCGEPYYFDAGTSGPDPKNYVGYLAWGMGYLDQSVDTVLRFELTDVDQGDEFVYARLVIPGLSSSAWTSTLGVNIVGIDEDSVPSFCSQPPWEGAATDNEVSWTLTSDWPSNDDDRDCSPLRRYTPDISSIVNEIVGRDNWGTNGRYLGLILEDATTACVTNNAALEDYRVSTDDNCLGAVIAPKIELYPTVRSTFLGKEMLGRPTDHAVTVNAYSLLEMAVYFEYKAQEDCSTVSCAGDSCDETPITTHGAAEPIEIVLGCSADDPDCTTAGLELEADTHYCYRMRYRPKGGGTFEATPWHSFRTQRSPGSAFVFTIQADSHLQGALRKNNEEALELYRCLLNDALKQEPDFHIDLGDTFHSEFYKGRNVLDFDEALDRHLDQRPFLDLLCHSAPFFFVLGNHEGEQGWRIQDEQGLPLWATEARTEIYPNPPGSATGFYSYSTTQEDYQENYYAWDWGNARFITLDAFRYTEKKPHDKGEEQKTGDRWDWTLGEDQYMWLKDQLEERPKPRYTFVFAHHVTGGVTDYGRGGAEAALHHPDFYPGSYEWGGVNSNGTWGFDVRRSGWDQPIHDLMAHNDTTIFFHGHDHVFAVQYAKRSTSTNGFGTQGFGEDGLSDNGVIYQECPQPGNTKYGPGFYENGLYYYSGHALNNSGYLKVMVSSDGVEVDYIRMTVEETNSNGYTCGDPEVAYSYAAACAGTCGACCLPDGTCDETLTVEECYDGGGVCRGCDATCATTDCSLPALDEAGTSGSCLEHDSEECCLTLDVGTVGVSKEPRLTTGLYFELDLDGTTKERVTAKITCGPSGEVFVLPNSIKDDATDEVLLELEPDATLPDKNCCRLELGGGAVGWLDFQSLVGDVDRDAHVTTADLASVTQHLGDPVTDSNCQYDVDADGAISTADQSVVTQRLGNAAEDCD